MPDLSILIPARNEALLQRTIEDIFAHARADTEVIAVLDGQWPDPPLPDYPKLRVTHSASVIGQRAATNLAAAMSRATYVMKLDAHCAVADGFDVALIEADRQLGRPDVTQIPAMYNLHAFNWKCRACGRETYQGPTPAKCEQQFASNNKPRHELHIEQPPCGASAGFDRVWVWKPRKRKAAGNGSDGQGDNGTRTEFWRFDAALHFQYWNDYHKRPTAKGDLVDVMSSVGACFFMRRERFWELEGLDERHGSWGQFGTEVACKSWLSGGRQIVNRRTWFAHLFRTQGGDFGFPYPMQPAQQDAARAHSRKLWIEATWPKAKLPLSWLIQKFAPVPDWPAGGIEGVRPTEHDSRLPGIPESMNQAPAAPPSAVAARAVTKGLVYYSDCRGDREVLTTVRGQIARAANGHQIVSTTLKPVRLGRNFVPLVCGRCGGTAFYRNGRAGDVCARCEADQAGFKALERGYLSMFRQILAGLEALDTDVAFLVEHDVLYHPSHFDFTPAKPDTFYYNQNTWRVNAETGEALFYYCNQVSGLCANRQLLVEHYRKRIAHVEAHGYDRNLGFEPGTNAKSQALDAHPVETWMSPQPNVDIKTKFSLTPGRWNPAQFRNKNSCLGWTEADAVPGWGVTKGRFAQFLQDVSQRGAETP